MKQSPKNPKDASNTTTVKVDSIWDDPVLRELLLRSQETSAEITVPHRKAEPLEEEHEERPDSQDPEEAHRLYYRVLNPHLRSILNPKNPIRGINPDAKKLIYQQKNLLLKDGHSKGRDGRQAYLSRLHQCIDIISRWERFCATDTLPVGETKIHRLYIMFKDAVDNLPKEGK